MAARSEYRPMPAMRAPARLARATVYVLIVATFTAVAALGGYEIGSRSRPTDANIGAGQSAAVRAAVTKAVAAKGRADQALRRRAIAKAMAFQKERDLELMQRRLADQHLADGRQAARAYSRGKAAGAASAKPVKDPAKAPAKDPVEEPVAQP